MANATVRTERLAGAETTAYRAAGSVSKGLYERAQRVMPGGNTRHSVALAAQPPYFKHASGCRVVDVEGEERIDFLNNYTSAILGHAHPAVVEAIQEFWGNATAISMPSEYDVKLAELLVDRVPYIDQIRFCNSGSEAVMLGIKAARAYTGKRKIAKFEGAYHGIYDYAQVSEGVTPADWGNADAPESAIEAGVSPGVKEDVVVLPWNRPDQCRNLLETHRNELAALLVDPLPAAIGALPPQDGFLEGLRALATELGILFISDEVLCFRLSYHGACHKYGIEPDITTLGKMIGGGFPAGAVAGKAEVMAVFDHTKEIRVHHGGTFNANPVTMLAGHATLQQMTPEAYDRLNALGDTLRARCTEMMQEIGMPGQVVGKGSIFCIHPTDAELIDYRNLVNARKGDPGPLQFTHEMLARGIVISPKSIFGCLSTPMAEQEIEAFITALRESFKTVYMTQSR